MKPRCVVCHKKITYQFYLCNVCEKTYGKRKVDWQPWLRFLINDAKKERMRISRGYYDREPSFSDTPEIENTPHIDDKDKDRF